MRLPTYENCAPGNYAASLPVRYLPGMNVAVWGAVLRPAHASPMQRWRLIDQVEENSYKKPFAATGKLRITNRLHVRVWSYFQPQI